VLVHCAHHKVGTVWWGHILRRVAAQCGARYAEVCGKEWDPSAGVYLFQHSRQFDRGRFAGMPFRGTHMIRDPRDVIVSGYFYHLWTDEPWANHPDPRFGGRSYRQELNLRDRDDGLMLELERTCRGQVRDMVTWDYGQPEFHELRYEDVMADEAGSFEQVFRHYGFRDRDIRRGLDVVEEMSFSRVSGRSVGSIGAASHLRSGRPGEWQANLTSAHLDRWRELAGDALSTLGYER